MGKTKTAFVGGTGETKKELTSEEQYQLKVQKKLEEVKALKDASAIEPKKASVKPEPTKEQKPENSEPKKDKKTEIESTKTMPGKGGQKLKVVSGEPETEESAKKEEVKAKTEPEIKVGKPKIRSKKYKEAKAKVDKSTLYSLPKAIELVKQTSFSKFDGTIELHLVVNKTGATANTTLPHSTGKSKKIEFATEKTLENLKKGKIDYDVLLATADMMPKLVPFAKLLGPKGLMPNPKTGTLVKDKAAADKFSSDQLYLKTEKGAPLIHTILGKVSTEDKKLLENLEAILAAISKNRIERAYLSSTMGPSVKIEV